MSLLTLIKINRFILHYITLLQTFSKVLFKFFCTSFIILSLVDLIAYIYTKRKKETKRERKRICMMGFAWNSAYFNAIRRIMKFNFVSCRLTLLSFVLKQTYSPFPSFSLLILMYIYIFYLVLMAQNEIRLCQIID